MNNGASWSVTATSEIFAGSREKPFWGGQQGCEESQHQTANEFFGSLFNL